MPINEYGGLDFPENPSTDDVFVAPDDQQWRFNGIEWAIHEPYYITDLTDVTTTNPQIGDVLEWNGTEWINVNLTGPDISELTDVVLTNPQNNDFFVFNGVDWINKYVGKKHFCSVYRYKITNTVEGLVNPLLVEYDTVRYDQNNLWDSINYRIVIQKQGTYSLYCCFGNVRGANTRQQYNVKIYDVNDNLKKDYVFSLATNLSGQEGLTNLNICYINISVDLIAGDYIQSFHTIPNNTSTNQIIDSYRNRLIIEQI